jgi:hypothetical protein
MCKYLEQWLLEQAQPGKTEPRSDATRDPLTVQLWFEAGHGMQASLHIGSSVHHFKNVMALARYLLELSEEREVFQAADTG